MSTLLREKLRRSNYISTLLLVLILLVGLIALVEKGPLVPGIPIGASPLSPLSLGTLELVYMLRRNYTVYVITEQSLLSAISGEICVFTTISPERPFTLEEATLVTSKLRDVCSKLKILVADESTNSNNILTALNSTIKVNGDRILVNYSPTITYTPPNYTIAPETPGLFYPLVAIHVDKTHMLRLDKASSVSGGMQVGYVLANTSHDVYLLNPDGSGMWIPPGERNITIASREVIGNVEVFVLGDGSIFLNQVLGSNRTEYRVFVEELFNHLCEKSYKCAIILDATHYSVLSLKSEEAVKYLLEQTMYNDTRILLYLIALIAPILIHPATWLPVMINTITSGYKTLLENHFTTILLLVTFTIIVYNMFSQHKILARDRPLREQLEEELGVFVELKKSVLARVVKLTAQDYVGVYSVLDNLSQLVWGLRFENPEIQVKLGELLGDPRRAEKIWLWIRKLYLKATGRSKLPIVLFWSRAVKRLVEFVEEISKKLSEKFGVEYL